MSSNGAVSQTALETSAVTWGGTELSYTIRRSARRKKTIAVTVDPAGSILVVAPERVGTDRLDTIVGRKAEWIARRIRRAESHGPMLSPREFVSGESVRYLGRHYRLKVDAGETGTAKLRGGWLHVPAPGDRGTRLGFARGWCRGSGGARRSGCRNGSRLGTPRPGCRCRGSRW